MRDGGYFGLHWIPRFNGGLFDDNEVLALNTDEIQLLYDTARLDWGQVEPSIFGTVFERSFDPRQRAQLGAHYTHKDDILLLVEPVLMAPLRREWSEIKQCVEALHVQWEPIAGNARRKLQGDAEGLILTFMERLAHTKVLDPACGSGNFLYVSLAQLKDLEKEVRTYAAGVGLPEPELGVTPAQFYGIEKNLVAAQLARIVVWIGYLQWQRTNGFWETEEPILQSLDTIQCRDAILGVDLHGNFKEPDWPEADVIVGNPPFLGTKKLKGELGTTYVTALHSLYSQRIPGFSDLVCYWFERSRTEMLTGRAKRVGLLATNSIRLGENRRVLEHIKEAGDIFFAYSDLPWTLDGAAVRISMVGFDNGMEVIHELDGKLVKDINPDLTSGGFTIKNVKPLIENASIAFLGDVKGGSFDIPHESAQEMLHDNNPHGCLNSDVLKRTANADDITKKWRNYWLIDFGTNMSLDEARRYVKPFQYVETVVKPEREKGKPSRSEWWLHMRPGPSMRKAITSLPRYIATPALSKHRLFVWFTPDILPTHAVIVFGRSDDYFFGVLHSRLHELWSLRMGSSLEDRPRYTPTTTFETYPFPWYPGKEPIDDPRVQAIAIAARELVTQRDAWLNPTEVWGIDFNKRTLTNLYNQRPDWLTEAHQRLDAAVFNAYGWPHDLSDEEILARLLALNLERAASQ